MFQSIRYTRYIELNSFEYELTDSDFSCVIIVSSNTGIPPSLASMTNGPGPIAVLEILIQEYSKRKLNVEANIIRYMNLVDKDWDFTIPEQIEWAERHCPSFTPELKTELDKYLTLL